MSVEENLRVLDRALEAMNAHDLNQFIGLHAESVIQRGPGFLEPLKGRAAVREQLELFLAAFPDLRVRKERSFGEGDWVCVEGVLTGTHKGPLAGPGGQMIPATNKQVRLPAAMTAKLEGGEITEVNLYQDQLEMMNQLGLKP